MTEIDYDILDLLGEPKWFVIESGEHAGRAHLRGWMHTAVKTSDDGSMEYERRHGWLALALCPRCHAVVLADDRHAYGDQTWAHERWHAATDYPMPAEVARREGKADS